MSALPFISHRLFVAAIRNQDCPTEMATAKQPAFSAAAPKPTVIPLEIVDSSKPNPAEAMRQSRASASTSG